MGWLAGKREGQRKGTPGIETDLGVGSQMPGEVASLSRNAYQVLWMVQGQLVRLRCDGHTGFAPYGHLHWVTIWVVALVFFSLFTPALNQDHDERILDIWASDDRGTLDSRMNDAG